MKAGAAYLEGHKQVAGIVYRIICTEFGLEGSRMKLGLADFLSDSPIQTN